MLWLHFEYGTRMLVILQASQSENTRTQRLSPNYSTPAHYLLLPKPGTVAPKPHLLGLLLSPSLFETQGMRGLAG